MGAIFIPAIRPQPVDALAALIGPLRDQEKGGCIPPMPGDPVSIPHDIENRGVATGIDQVANPQVSDASLQPPQVAESTGSPSQGGDTGSNPVGTTQVEHVGFESG